MPDCTGPLGKPSRGLGKPERCHIPESGSDVSANFALFTSSRRPKANLHFSHERYLVYGLREEFGSTQRRFESSNAGSKAKHRKIAEPHRPKTTNRDFSDLPSEASPCVQACLL